MKLFLNDVSDYSVEQLVDRIADEFMVDKGNLENYEFIVASIHDYDYESAAYFLVKHRETGEYYEVEAAHCSCMGYEDQWEPKIASRVYLQSPQYKAGEPEVQNFVRSLFN